MKIATKLSNTQRTILTALPTEPEKARTVADIADELHLAEGSVAARLPDLEHAKLAVKIKGDVKGGRGTPNKWYRLASLSTEAGVSAPELLYVLAAGAGASLLIHRLPPLVPAGAWLLMGIGVVVAVVAARRPAQTAPQMFTGPVPLALSRADAARDRAEGVADHAIYVAPPALLMETVSLVPSLAERRARLRKAGGVPVEPLRDSHARKTPANRGGISSDLLVVLAIIGLFGMCGCDPPPPNPEDITVDSPLAVTKCELLAEKIERADGPAQSARASGIAQTCYLRLIEHRLSRIERLVPPDPPPPPAPAEAPSTQPQPRPARKTPLSDLGIGGGPDVRRAFPPSPKEMQ